MTVEKTAFWGAVYKSETSHLGETSHLSEILFIPRLHDKNIPPE